MLSRLINKEKLYAFTLLEIMLVLLLSSIVMASTWLAYEFLYSQYYRIKQHNETNEQLALLQTAVFHDIEQATNIRYLLTGEIILENEYNKTINYKLTNDFITREINGLTDTFRINTQNIELVKTDKNSEYLNQINFDVVIDKQVLTFRLSKKYASDFYMNPKSTR